MSRISIDRLILNVPGMSESDGRRLAQQVAHGLDSIGYEGAGLDLATMNLELKPRRGDGVDELASQIIAEFARQVGRLP